MGKNPDRWDIPTKMTILPRAPFSFPHANRPTRPMELRQQVVARRHCLCTAPARATASRPCLRSCHRAAASRPCLHPRAAVRWAPHRDWGGKRRRSSCHLRFIIHGERRCNSSQPNLLHPPHDPFQPSPPPFPSSLRTPGGAPPMAAVVLGEHRCHYAISPFHHWGQASPPPGT